MSRALRFVGVRDRTEQEVRAHLLKRGCSPGSADEILGRLRTWGYLDDARVALSYARGRLERDHWGPARLVREMGRRGIAPELVHETLRRLLDDVEEISLARHAAERYLRAHPGATGERGMRRLAGFLGRRGYSGEVVSRLVRESFGA
jgi:regulatory protein